MTNPNLPPSEEGIQHRFTEVVLREDWHTRFTVNPTGVRAVKAELDETQDPDRIIELTELNDEALVRTLGSGALSLHKRDVVAEREQFEADFGGQP